MSAEGGGLHLTLTVGPKEAQLTGGPERITRELLPISETHFLMPPVSPLDDVRTLVEGSVGAFATTEYFAVDAANAVGLPRQ